MRPLLFTLALFPLALAAQSNPAGSTSPGSPPAGTLSDKDLDSMIFGDVPGLPSGKSAPHWWEALKGAMSSELRLNASLGYKDNTIYSPFRPERTLYARNSAEFTLFGLPTASPNWQWYAYTLAENVHNFDVSQIRDEQLFMAIGEAKRTVGSSAWKIGSQFQYFYMHQAFDVSQSEVLSSTSDIRLRQCEIHPLVEYALDRTWTANLQGILGTARFATPLDNYDRHGVRLALTGKFDSKDKLDFVFQQDTKDYARRTKRNLSGTSIAGSHLDRGQQSAEASWKHPWTKDGSFSTTSKVRYRLEDDNGLGYYDSDQWLFSQKISWEPKDWECSLAYKFQLWDYHHQAGLTSGATHWRQTDSLEVRVEYSLRKNWKVFLSGEFEYTNSDQRAERYPRNLGEIGMSFIY